MTTIYEIYATAGLNAVNDLVNEINQFEGDTDRLLHNLKCICLDYQKFVKEKTNDKINEGA